MVVKLHDALKELIKDIFIYVRAAFWTITRIYSKICGTEVNTDFGSDCASFS